MLEDCLDDLAVRFLLYLPEADTATFDRLGFHLEQAYWFYCDIYHQRHPHHYPSMSMRTFTKALLARCRHHGHHFAAIDHLSDTPNNNHLDEQLARFSRYKAAVPVCGTALISDTGKVLMVKGIGSRSRWGFPKGKINKDERPWQCARRECLEECGFDPATVTGDREPPFVDALLDGKPVRVYVVVGVGEGERFAPRTRNEIGAIAWHLLTDLPTRKQHQHSRLYHHVVPFVKRIKLIANYGTNGTADGIIGTDQDQDPYGKDQDQPYGKDQDQPEMEQEQRKRVSIGELMRRSANQQPTQNQPPKEPQVIIDSESDSDTEPDPLLPDINVTPVWSGKPTADSLSLLHLLTHGRTDPVRVVGREECVRRLCEVLPVGGMSEQRLDELVEVVRVFLGGIECDDQCDESK